MSAQRAEDRSGDGAVAVLLLAVLGGLALLWAYGRFQQEINGLLVRLHRILLLPFAWDATTAQVLDSFRVRPAREFEWRHLNAQMAFVGSWWRWPVAAVLTAAALLLHRRGRAFRRPFSMRSLLTHNVAVFPCLAPVAWRGLDREPLDRGPWRAALTPVEFACGNGLLIDGRGLPVSCGRFIAAKGEGPDKAGLVRDNSRDDPRLAAEVRIDRDRAITCFARQLGAPFRGGAALADHEAGLAAAFILFGLGDRTRGAALLDFMSLSFREATAPGAGRWTRFRDELVASRVRGAEVAYCVAAAWRAARGRDCNARVGIRFHFRGENGTVEAICARKIVEEHLHDTAVVAASRNHRAWTRTLLCALLRFARRKGVVAPAEFVWLRPLDRPLWYALHQVSEAVRSGGAGVDRGLGAWSEAAGVWAHMAAEGVMGRALDEPCVEFAVEALERTCVDEGWIAEPPDPDLDAGPAAQETES